MHVSLCCSILGMNLFGCKFCETMKGSSDVECDRKNFDSLLWAIVTVFQVPTKKKILFHVSSRGHFDFSIYCILPTYIYFRAHIYVNIYIYTLIYAYICILTFTTWHIYIYIYIYAKYAKYTLRTVTFGFSTS